MVLFAFRRDPLALVRHLGLLRATSDRASHASVLGTRRGVALVSIVVVLFPPFTLLPRVSLSPCFFVVLCHQKPLTRGTRVFVLWPKDSLLSGRTTTSPRIMGVAGTPRAVSA